MIGRIIEVVRLAVYGIVLFNAIGSSWWIAVAFGIVFFHLELAILALTVFRKKIQHLEDTVTELKKELEVPEIDFGFEFSSEPLTSEEEGFLEVAKSGNVEGIENFLASRCEDKTVDFTIVSTPVKLIMTAKVLSLVERQHDVKIDNEWADVIEDKSDNN